MLRARSRAPSWMLRGSRLIGVFGLRRNLRAQAEQSLLLARYNRVVPSFTLVPLVVRPLPAGADINVALMVVGEVVPGEGPVDELGFVEHRHVWLNVLFIGYSLTEATNQDEAVAPFRSRREFEGAHHCLTEHFFQLQQFCPSGACFGFAHGRLSSQALSDGGGIGRSSAARRRCIAQ